MGLLTEAADERTIDRELDQTAPHIHAEDSRCPTCDAVAAIHDEPTPLEQRILELEQDLHDRDRRILAFEKFTERLSTHIDGMRQAVEQTIEPVAELPRAA